MTPFFSRQTSLEDWLRGMVEHVFMVEVGICDLQVTRYLTQILTEFVHTDRIFRLQTVDGDTIRSVSRMEADAALPAAVDDAQRRRLVNRYIGDFTLFWTGVYPETLRPRHQHGADRLREYLLQGKRSYGIASELSTNDADPPANLLASLSEQFECCVHGLHLVRESWERSGRN